MSCFFVTYINYVTYGRNKVDWVAEGCLSGRRRAGEHVSVWESK